MKRKTISKLVCFILCLILLAGSVTFAESESPKKSETIYVILDSDGKVLDEKVVNRINFEEGISDLKDYGEYSSLKNMKTDAKAEVSGSEITWKAEAAKAGAVFYEGITDKQLPIDIAIEYFLNGEKINAADLVGKDGLLRIEIKLKNLLKVNDAVSYKNYSGKQISVRDDFYVPLMVQVGYVADMDTFYDINAKDAVSVVTGSSMNINFAVFPYPEEELSLEMRGDDIELGSLTITVLPQYPAIPEFDFEEDFVKVIDGVKRINSELSKMGEGSDSILSSSDQIINGAGKFSNGMEELINGYSQIENGSNDLASGIDAGVKGIEQLKDSTKALAEGLGKVSVFAGQLSEAAETSANTAEMINGRTTELAKVSEEQLKKLTELSVQSGELIKTAEKLTKENPEGSELYNLGLAILTQSMGLKEIADKGVEIAQGLGEIGYISGSLSMGMKEQLSEGLLKFQNTLKEMENGSQMLFSGMEAYAKGQFELKEGFARYRNGITETGKGLRLLNSNVDKMLAELSGISEYKDEMMKGLDSMDTNGLSDMENGLIKAVDEMRLGKAKTDKMKELAEGYRSFMDNDKNKNSSVQFIMKTKQIKHEKENKELPAIQKEGKEGFWARLLALFGVEK